MFPILCRSCGTLEETDVLKMPISCPRCHGSDVVPYDSAETIGETGTDEVAGVSTRKKLFRDLVLTDGTYFCPSCQRMEMRFENRGSFHM
jgi:hypothetical protein